MTTPAPTLVGWSSTKCQSDDGSLPTFSGQHVIDELVRLNPAPLFVASYPSKFSYQKKSSSKPPAWVWNFCATYSIEVNGWQVSVQAHVHIKPNGDKVSGNTYIPGFEGAAFATPVSVHNQVPTYDASTHNKAACSDSGAQDLFYQGANRYPHKH